jgi:pyruvate formate lyase activating enzyme
MSGLIFDIKEFAVHDGSGIRTTVFLKGCPLRCVWCHNPEGLSPKKELYISQNNCTGCGLCRRECSHEDCKPFGRCLHICPQDLVRVAGEEWEAQSLAQKLLRHEQLFKSTGGGVTVSGGEPLLQADFCAHLLGLLKGRIHTAIETSGYASEDDFKRVAELCDFVFMDIKLADPKAHKTYTGVDNTLILKNAEWLKNSGKAHAFRTPLIPGITDTEENLKAIGQIVGESTWERLPYNELAPVKYKNVGREYDPEGHIKSK